MLQNAEGKLRTFWGDVNHFHGVSQSHKIKKKNLSLIGRPKGKGKEVIVHLYDINTSILLPQ